MSHYIPEELQEKILSLLPAESLLRMKSVCKKWLNIIQSPTFVKEHTMKHLHSHTILVQNESCEYALSLESLDFINSYQQADAIQDRITPYTKGTLSDIYDVAICHGLILVLNMLPVWRRPRGEMHSIWAIHNWLTNEYHMFDPPYADSSMNSFGFGYVDDEYKVMRVDQIGRLLKTSIYSLQSASWKLVLEEKIASCINRSCYGMATFFDGALCWYSRGEIVAFDLKTEQYFHLPSPRGDLGRPPDELLELDGCLVCTCTYYAQCRFDGWIMKIIDGKKMTWEKLFSVILPSFHDSPYRLKLVAYLKSKDQIVLQHEDGFLWCCLKNKDVKKICIDSLPPTACSRICMGSVLRINTREKAAVFSARKDRRSARLKICVRDVGSECAFKDCFCRRDTCRCSLL